MFHGDAWLQAGQEAGNKEVAAQAMKFKHSPHTSSGSKWFNSSSNSAW